MDEHISNFIHDIIDNDLANGFSRPIHTRFPPEPNGYLHIGSAKAVWINAETAKKYGGLFNLRYDDTNPTKEDVEYVESIERDIRWLGYDFTGGIFYGSDYFDKCCEFAFKLIRDGKAFVCDLSPEEMREYRGTLVTPGKNSPYRDRSVEENFDLFTRMRDGEFPNGSKTLRVKIDMASGNMTLRDPAIYRISHTEHFRQGGKWCIYPMYDFAHPIQDALEGITHSCCSIEFDNNRPLYDWVVENIGFVNPPHQYEFSRLNVTYTVMSKRFLRELVETGSVDGWDDPRMPTLCGLRRRGYTPAAIKDFLRRCGVARTYGIVEIGMLESCIRDELNRTAPRRMAIADPVKLVITNYPEDKTEYFDIANDPQNEAPTTRKVEFSRELWIEREDFAEVPPPKFRRLFPGNEVRLMGSYIVKCNEIVKDESGKVTEIRCTADLETVNNNPADGRKVKGTIHWVSAKNSVSAELRVYDYLFTQANVFDLPEGGHYRDLLRENSVSVYPEARLEACMTDINEGDSFQFVRNGYFCRDKNEDVFNCIVGLKDTWAKEQKK